ncbi:hypothetical protein ACFXNW_13375 [Nocardia sp. NPDC059180]|uniref:hypothetical protein n=1 Tax=Nocardia sp. NPDC059180 TaxID=3346761 RepID=UPI0036B24A0A
MTATAEPDGLAEFAIELKLLAEAVLERVEPVLRRAAADGSPEWDNCSWCPVCAAAALVRGEQHDVLSAIADHGTAIVTVLREALAGVPVEPVMPEDGAEHGVRHRHHAGAGPATASREESASAHSPRSQGAAATSEDATGSFEPPGDPTPSADSRGARSERGRSRLRRTTGEGRRSSTRKATAADAVRADIRSGGTPAEPAGVTPEPDAGNPPGRGGTSRSGTGGTADPGAGNAPRSRAANPAGAGDSGSRAGGTSESGASTTRARYVGIPVTIKP